MTTPQPLVDVACATFAVTVRQELKHGGQKYVFLVEGSAGPAVLKIIQIQDSADEAAVRAGREVKLLGSLDSPYVVKAASELTFLESPKRAVTWLEEFIPGDDVGDLLAAQWSIADVVQMGRDVATGLGELHARGVVHRDLSANNVRRRTGGGYVILDPGYARHTLLSGITYGGQPGTYNFLSPEHVLAMPGGPLPSSDVFQVGILMYAALTGRVPIQYTGDENDYFTRLVSSLHQPISEARSDVPDNVCSVIARCLHAQSGRRYRNGARLAEALEELENGSPD